MKDHSKPGRRSILAAALARLVPPGAGPGAVEAGAVEYAVQRLDGEQPAPWLMDGLDLLDRLALEHDGAHFEELGPARQDEVLRRFEEDPVGTECLRRLVLLALEGSFCHPARGGNRHGAGWRFAGLDNGERSDPSRCRAS